MTHPLPPEMAARIDAYIARKVREKVCREPDTLKRLAVEFYQRTGKPPFWWDAGEAA